MAGLVLSFFRKPGPLRSTAGAVSQERLEGLPWVSTPMKTQVLRGSSASLLNHCKCFGLQGIQNQMLPGLSNKRQSHPLARGREPPCPFPVHSVGPFTCSSLVLRLLLDGHVSSEPPCVIKPCREKVCACFSSPGCFVQRNVQTSLHISFPQLCRKLHQGFRSNPWLGGNPSLAQKSKCFNCAAETPWRRPAKGSDHSKWNQLET